MKRACFVLLVALVAATAACDDDSPSAQPSAQPSAMLPLPVAVRSDPEGVTLADPAFQPLPGARADFGRVGGASYMIEIPADWNGRLVLYVHGFENFAPEAQATPPDFRHYLVGHGYAWGASSFSSTSSIPGRSADETAALWDYFAQTYGRPRFTYVTGLSMGGAATFIAAERYPDRFDGGLSLCGGVGNDPSVVGVTDMFVAGAYVAGVTQVDFDAAADTGALIRQRILPALQDPAKHRLFEDIMVDLTGGPRLFARQGFHLEEETNWALADRVIAARLGANTDRVYDLGPDAGVTGDGFNRAAVRLSPDAALLARFSGGQVASGAFRVPVLAMHTTGDGLVPFEDQRIIRQRADAAGTATLLVQREYADPGHCGFNTAEQEAGFEALVRWVEDGQKPDGDDILAADRATLGLRFPLLPRPGTAAADGVSGAGERVVVHGTLTVDGAPVDATFLGAVVLRDGLITPCQYELSTVEDGGYTITVMGDTESAGCGDPGARIALWAYAGGRQLYSTATAAWPDDGRDVGFDPALSTTMPDGAAGPSTQFSGEVYTGAGERVPPGTRIEAYIGDTRCGVAATRRTGSFSGYVLAVAAPATGGCAAGGTIAFRVDGRPAEETAVNDPQAPRQGGAFDLTVD